MRPSIRSAAISAVIAIGLAGAAVAEPDRARAREHFVQAEMYMKTGVYDQAVLEYQMAYEYAPGAHGFLFNIGLAYEKWGKKEEAVDAYADYLEKEPRGKKAPEARARKVALERAIAAAKAEAERRAARQDATGPEPPVETRDRPDPRIVETKPRPAGSIESPRPSTGREVSWGRLAIGATAVAVGLAVDLAPDSSSNGELDMLDLVPIGLYGAGAFFVYTGVF